MKTNVSIANIQKYLLFKIFMEQIIKRIIDLIKEKGLSLRFVSEKIGLSSAGLNKTLKDKSLRVSILLKLSEFLEVPVTYFFQDMNFDYGTLKFQKSTVLNALENGIVKISVEPLLRDIIKNDFTDDFVQKAFEQTEPIGFYDLFDRFLSDEYLNNEAKMDEAEEFFDTVGYLLYDVLTKKEIIVELNSLNLVNVMSLASECRAFVFETRDQRLMWNKGIV